MKLRAAFISFTIFILIVPFIGFCQDYGVTIENVTGVDAQDNFIFSQSDKAGIWFGAKNENMELKAQGSYLYSLGSPYFFDLDYLYFTIRFRSDDAGASLHSIKLGRFVVSESSRYVLDAPLDGALLSYAFPSFTISFYAGFSGLIWNPERSTIDMTLADNSDKSGNSNFFLGPPRIIEMLSVVIPEVFPFHTLTVSILGQEDSRNPSNLIQEGETVRSVTRGGALHSVYAGFGLDGSISSTAYYNLFGYFETGTTLSYVSDYRYKPIIAGLSGASFSLYFEKLLFSRVELGGVYSTGDEDYATFKEANSSDVASMFVPISNRLLAIVFSPELGNLFFFSASYSIKPFSGSMVATLENLQTMVRGLVFFRSGMGPVSGVAINSSSDSLYLGTEADLVVNYRPASDVGISLSAGFFFPDKGSASSTIVNDGKPFKFSGKLELSIGM